MLRAGSSQSVSRIIRKAGKQEGILGRRPFRQFFFLFSCFPDSSFRSLLWLLAIFCPVWFAMSSSAADAPSFRNQVQPILARYGCSAGACHGAAAGQGGFKLSLRGYDNEGDFLTITKSAEGRRVNLDDPARSLLLLKATKLIPHKGGERFKMDSPEYKILADWIASGAPGPQEN